MGAKISAGHVAQVVAIAVCVGFLLLAFGTTGIGYSSDSFAYLAAAESLQEEGVLSNDFWLVHYPPLYASLLLLVGTDPSWITVLQVAVFAINIGLIGYMLSMLQVNEWFIAGALLVIGTSPVMLLWHGYIHSEGVYFVLMQLGIILLARDRLRWAALVIALAPLQRYVGVTLIALGCVVILIRHGWLRAALFGVLTSTPVAVWLLRNEFILDIPGRNIHFLPISLEKITEGIVNLAPWLFPMSGLLILALLFTRHIPPVPVIVRIVLLYIAGYLAFMMISISFFDNFTPLDYRILAPVIILSWITIIWLLDSQIRQLAGGWQRTFVGMVCLVAVAYLSVSTWYGLANLRPNGIGLVRATRPVHEAVVDAVPEDKFIYSNQRWLVDMLGRSSRTLPFRAYSGSLVEIVTYDEEMNQLINDVLGAEAVILWFREFERPNLVSLDELTGFLPQYTEHDGLVVFSVEPVNVQHVAQQ